MKIEGGIKTVQGLTGGGENRPKPQPGAGTQKGGEAKVELSSLSASLAKAEATIASTPAVDRSRVDEIRAAISEGRFKVDAGKIADGLIDSVRQMLGDQRPR
ncbi:MAG TPA: flagellar biosynthesis anti-sigma factor FlgM [Azoarcus taiwanensis]|uniref:Negative regulator of flagellin synthesis n=1 Tax=Azoarcus taiwanensis TaxID=666964 RepID=A0A972J9G3_9RHOO|nr:flagellar biosynthesis anti-sigma factor FlgM [Azoarcus taiwanensis]HRQ58846.1 flagellar biosynthesis anti-sigma factor FlgM [Azoarcus taiwanensis]